MEDQASIDAMRHARSLRANMTDGERRLSDRLRRERLGVKFRRQHPLGTYVLDFVCIERGLVVEIDGSQHLEQVEYDRRRESWLRQRGFAILRFWSNEVLSQTDSVVEVINQHLHATDRTPSPTGGRLGRGRVTVQQPSERTPAPAPTPTLPQRGREPENRSNS